jgi:hypothetical protein
MLRESQPLEENNIKETIQTLKGKVLSITYHEGTEEE